MTQLALVFRALADVSRLRIVNILSHRRVCVSELQTVLGFSQPFISRHLACLRKVGLVRGERQGARVYYSLTFENRISSTLQAFLGEVLMLSPAFQTDLKRLIECGRSGRLKSYTVCPVSEGRDRTPTPMQAPLTSKAA
jgi:ArsR family transcriptional regulator